MDEQELDEWFEEERKRIEKVFYDALMKQNVPWKAAKKSFNGKYTGLIHSYQRKKRLNESQQRVKDGIAKPWKKLDAAAISFENRIQAWFTKKGLEIKKLQFKRKMKKILKKRDTYP